MIKIKFPPSKEFEPQEQPDIKLLDAVKPFLPFIALGLFVMWLVRPILVQDGLPWGTDVHGHLARVWYVAKSIKEVGAFPSWFPYWYNGTPLLQYYPPLTTYLMLPIQLIFNDVTITYKVFVLAMLFLSGAFTYQILFSRFGKTWALLAAMIYISAPYTFYAIFDEGNLPKVMAIAVIPLILELNLRFMKNGNRGTYMALIFSTVVLLVTHHQQAIMVFLIFGLVSLLLIDQNSDSKFRFGMIIGSYAFSILLSAVWLIPALTHIDYPNVPNLSLLPERVPLYSIGWRALSPVTRVENIESVYVGFSLVILATIAVFIVRSRQSFALFIGAMVSIALAFGVNNPIYQYLPFNESFLPERFLHIATLLFAVLIANYGQLMIDQKLKREFQILVLIGAGIISVVDFSTYWGLPKIADYPEVRNALNEVPRDLNSSRLDVRSSEGSIWSLLPLTQGDKHLTFGWSIETTPHQSTFSQINLAIRRGFPEFVPRNYFLWNVDTSVIASEETSIIETLLESGYRETGSTGRSVVLTNSAKPALFKKLASNSIVIGRGAHSTSTVLPWMSYGVSWNVDDYDQQYLQQFDLIYLYDFRYDNIFELENSIREWIQNGKTIVLDLTAMQDNNIFGVEANLIELPNTPRFNLGPEADFEIDTVAEEPFVYQGDPWRGVSYSGLDGEILSVFDVSGNQASVVGYKELPEGRVYYLGLNWISHIMDSRDQSAITFLTDFLQRADPYQEIQLPEISTITSDQPSDKWSFTYEADQKLNALISVTWSPHWTVVFLNYSSIRKNLKRISYV
jgi:uncharacterized membrane protein